MRTLLLSLFICLAISIQFSVSVGPEKVRCFYEHLDYQAKFNVEVTPMEVSQYEFFIQSTESGEVIFSKLLQGLESTVVSKFSPQANYYGFCIRNLLSTPMNTVFKLESGIELMQLSLLPNHSDNEYLNTEIGFLEKQKEDLFRILQSLEGSKQYTETLTNMMGTSAIWLALAGLVAILVVNLGFYKQIKSTLKQRKLI